VCQKSENLTQKYLRRGRKSLQIGTWPQQNPAPIFSLPVPEVCVRVSAMRLLLFVRVRVDEVCASGVVVNQPINHSGTENEKSIAN